MNKTPKTIKNSEYRSLLINGLWEVWLVSFATGKKLKKVLKKNIFHNKEAADIFIDWLNDYEKNN